MLYRLTVLITIYNIPCSRYFKHLQNCTITQQLFTCSKSTIETLEKKCEICSKLTIKTPEQHQWHRSSVLLDNIIHISYLFLVFLLLTLNKWMLARLCKLVLIKWNHTATTCWLISKIRLRSRFKLLLSSFMKNSSSFTKMTFFGKISTTKVIITRKIP